MPIYPNSQCPPPLQFLLSLLACSHPLSFPAAPSSSPSLPSSILLSQCQVPSLTYQLFSPILHPLPSQFPSSSLQVVTPLFASFFSLDVPTSLSFTSPTPFLWQFPPLPSMFPSPSLPVLTSFSPTSHASTLPQFLPPLLLCSPLSFSLVTPFFPSLLTKYLISFYLDPQGPLFLLFHWA